jgi:hypothetical protein
MSSGKNTNQWHPVSIMLAGTMATAIIGTVTPLVHGLRSWVPGVAGVFLAAMTFLVGMVLVNAGTVTIWRIVHTMTCLIGGGVLAALIATWGWSSLYAIILIGSALALLILSYGIPVPVEKPTEVDDGVDRRPAPVREWEALLRAIVGKPVVVEAVRPWDVPEDGERVTVALPPDGSVTADRISDPKITTAIATARHLPHGCNVQVEDGEHQAQVHLDVMLRNTMTVEEVLQVDTTPRSVNDPIKVMNGARSEDIRICLREDTLVIGGATKSGKTTFLDGLIMRLNQCIDNLTWTLDLNGGGLAETHLRGLAFGAADRSPLDWCAGDPYEGLAMAAALVAIAHGRKTSTESVNRKRAAKTKEVPVDKDFPQITMVADEVGEMKKRGKAATINSLLDERIEQTIQIGRAEACRVIQSVLRGTTDVTTRGAKVQAAIRICLRMNEDVEYSHVLGRDPGSLRLTLKGQGWVLRGEDTRPILARTIRVAVDTVEAAAVAVLHLRPRLDEGSRTILAGLRVADIFPENVQEELWKNAPQLAEDLENGRLYTGRWERAAEMLSRIGGGVVQVKPAPAPKHRPVTSAPEGSNADKLLKMLGQTHTAADVEKPQAPRNASETKTPAPEQQAAEESTAPRVEVSDDDVAAVFAALMDPTHYGVSAPDPSPRPRPSLVKGSEPTVRERLLAALKDAYPEGMTSEQLAALPGITKQRRKQILDLLEERGVIRFEGSRWFYVQG